MSALVRFLSKDFQINFPHSWVSFCRNIPRNLGSATKTSRLIFCSILVCSIFSAMDLEKDQASWVFGSVCCSFACRPLPARLKVRLGLSVIKSCSCARAYGLTLSSFSVKKILPSLLVKKRALYSSATTTSIFPLRASAFGSMKLP